MQLFLSKRIVTKSSIIDGGVLVKNGVIKEIVHREDVVKLLNETGDHVEVIDGGEWALLPGVVDAHVHVNEPGRTAWEGFQTATMAAAAGGTTTIVDMPLNSIPPTTTVENLKIKANAAQTNIYVDVAFWAGVIPGNQDSLQDLVDCGVVGFKCFLCPSGVEEFPNVDAKDLELAFKALEGTGSVLAFHAEVDIEDSPKDYLEKDPEEFTTYMDSRPPEMEVNAVSLIASLLPQTDVRIHIVHVSSSSVVPLLEKARELRKAAGHTAWQYGVTAETCHHYLTLSAEDIPKGRSEFKCAPPIRDRDNKEKLWECVAEDKINMVVSDHSPCTPNLKCSNNLTAWGGISSIQFGLSLFWTSASARGMDLRAIVKYLCDATAKLCGLDDRKGGIQPGLDADLVFFDPEGTYVVAINDIKYKNKLSPYVGKTLKGVVKKTYLRGKLIYSNGNIVDQPAGELLFKKSCRCDH